MKTKRGITHISFAFGRFISLIHLFRIIYLTIVLFTNNFSNMLTIDAMTASRQKHRVSISQLYKIHVKLCRLNRTFWTEAMVNKQ